MTTLTDRDVVEKWSHIAMKLFPPQMDISVAQVNGSWNVCARWKVAESGVDPLTRGMRGVDLYFDEKSIADYLSAGVDAQLKCDLYIEARDQRETARLRSAREEQRARARGAVADFAGALQRRIALFKSPLLQHTPPRQEGSFFAFLSSLAAAPLPASPR
jgi:hypothetical protein